jgi:Glycosyltransferase family 87
VRTAVRPTESPSGRFRNLGWGWVGLGLAGSALLTTTASELLDRKPIPWFWIVDLPVSRPWIHHLFWLGVAALCIAWLGIGRRLWRGGDEAPGVGALFGVGALWSLPLIVGPVPFSHDIYSYLAQGSLLHHGVNPYMHGPSALAQVHESRLLSTVSPFWRHTTAPYGPGFIGLAALAAGLAGSHLVFGVILLRLVSVAGIVLLAVFVPRLAKALGADPARAVWLAVISPLVLLELIAAGHNDALMAGLLVAGVCLAVERRPLLGIALCSAAVAVKLPAAAGVVFVAAAWLRATPSPRERARNAALTVAVVVIVLGVVSLVAGVGAHWVSGKLLSTPGRVHLAITPATAAGYSIASLLRSLDIASVGFHSLESAFAAVAVALTAGLGAVLCWRVRYERLALYLGILLLAAVLGGPATWPWYLTWGVALLAVDPRAQRSLALPAVLVLACFAIAPGGLVAVALPKAPWMFGAYVAAAIAAIVFFRPRPPGRSIPAVA